MLNADKPGRWNEDTRKSVLQYNGWFLDFAPKTYQDARGGCMDAVTDVIEATDNLRTFDPKTLLDSPGRLTVMRQLCAPPLARDRLAGLAEVAPSRIKTLENGDLPFSGRGARFKRFASEELPRVLGIVERLLDTTLMPWLLDGSVPSGDDLTITRSVVADRLCGAMSDPIIRNAQEARQLAVISGYLEPKGYRLFDDPTVAAFDMPAGTFSYHKSVRMFKNAEDDSDGYVNTPVDVVIAPLDGATPILIECKSAGDFANVNKRRKEEDAKVTQLRATYGDVTLYLFLCGYFDATYLGYEAANHMDWIWEHRVSDFEELGL